MFSIPRDPAELLRRKKALRRELLSSPQAENFPVKKIALLGGATTSEFRDCLELFLLADGIRPEIYESAFGQFFEESCFGSEELNAFRPDLVILFTSSVNVQRWPEVSHSPEEVALLLTEETKRLTSCWEKLRARTGCPVIQNNFDPPHFRLLGNADCVDHRGRTRFVNLLNHQLAIEAGRHPGVYLHDLSYAASRFGLDRWHDRSAWHAYKFPFAMEAMPLAAQSTANMVRALFGRTRKCLVLDLDNTLWGGIIGDDGIQGIQLGAETPDGAAHLDLQRYAKLLHERGVLLAVCSKNEKGNAIAGLNHPEGALKPGDFELIQANWEPKNHNISQIANALNIGLDSLVFLDDNPAEREIVRISHPQVAVPEVGERVEEYLGALEREGYFETLALSEEDLSRARMYKENSEREQLQGQFESYVDFLESLHMEAEIAPFREEYFDRIHQLVNKTNQFNLTTRRCTKEEVALWSSSPGKIALFGRLRDRFGDNGLVSVVTAEVKESIASVDIWLMSCRVIKRGLELAMMEALVKAARQRGVREIRGFYRKSPKNKMVEGLLGELGFRAVRRYENGDSDWHFEIPESYRAPMHLIQVKPNEPENPIRRAGNLP